MNKQRQIPKRSKSATVDGHPFWMKALKAFVVLVPMGISIYGAVVSTKNASRTSADRCYTDFSSYREDVRKAYQTLLTDYSLFANEPTEATYLVRANGSLWQFTDTLQKQVSLAARYPSCALTIQNKLRSSLKEAESLRAIIGADGPMPRLDILAEQAKEAISLDPQGVCCNDL